MKLQYRLCTLRGVDHWFNGLHTLGTQPDVIHIEDVANSCHILQPVSIVSFCNDLAGGGETYAEQTCQSFRVFAMVCCLIFQTLGIGVEQMPVFPPNVPPVLFSLQSWSAYIVIPWENTLDDLVENTLLISYLLLLWSISLNGFKILDIDRLLNLSYPFHIKIVGECKFLKRWYTSLKLAFGDTHEQTMRCIMFNVVAYLI